MANLVLETLQVVVVLLCIFNDGMVTADECQQIDSCSCQFPDGTKIDLSPLSSSDVNTPRFYDVPVTPGSDDMFSWNPCADFLQPTSSTCQGVAVCHIHLAPPIAVYFNLGTTDSAAFSTNDAGQVELSYRHIETGTPITQRSAHIALLCDQTQDGLLVPLFEIDPGSGQFHFELHSKYTCYGDNVGDNVSPFSVGTIVCLVALALVLVYVIGGVGYNSLYKKSIGIERIPNVTVWRKLPGLIKDGFKFVFTGGRASGDYRNI
ncbi:uncharacterized protein LOC117344180 [Pecten maximus]|uniref:uncharacterized protein LOC117344180 n=1 Tax=Pecten maximus TaxID=6579 RepID=UPI0014584250|nr:uncharacterized protein LOC117344180 [Pecten maximus]